jgi:hypothetical protein
MKKILLSFIVLFSLGMTSCTMVLPVVGSMIDKNKAKSLVDAKEDLPDKDIDENSFLKLGFVTGVLVDLLIILYFYNSFDSYTDSLNKDNDDDMKSKEY